MDYEIMTLFIRLGVYCLSFLIFVAIVKSYMKRRLSYSKIIIAGFIAGLLISSIWIIIGYIVNPESSLLQIYFEHPAFMIGQILGEIIIVIIVFIVLYSISKPIYNRIKK